MHDSTVSTDPDPDHHRPSGELWGIQLRYLLTVTLFEQGPMTVPELIDALGRDGFTVPGRPSKTVSDAGNPSTTAPTGRRYGP